VRVVFLGSGSFAIPSLEAVARAGHEIAAVVTQPDKEKGRGRALAPPPLKPVAQDLGLTVLQPAKVRSADTLAALAPLHPDVQIVVAYGQILPRTVLDLAPRGTINVHASLLPRYRGAAPIQWAIANGEPETGVTTMLLDDGLDTGPILEARATPIGVEESAGELQERLASMGALLLLETLAALAAGSLTAVPQDHARATLAPILKKSDGLLDWHRPARELHDRVRGFSPWPGAFTQFRNQQLKVHAARVLDPTALGPGHVGGTKGDLLVVGCGSGTCLGLLEVQPEGRRRMSGAAFAAGARLLADETLG
jgi:methionyl-tRNA formyltransferase